MSDRSFKSERHHSLNSSFPSEPMNYRIGYTPRPAVRINWWRRALRNLINALT